MDQSVIAGNNLGGYINECCKYIAPTFTAGSSGFLAGIRIDFTAVPNATTKLHVTIRSTVSGGAPSSTVLGETTLDSGAAPMTLFIAFQQAIPLVAGDQYAIVVHYVDAPSPGVGHGQGVWLGVDGDPYPGGRRYQCVSDNSPWTPSDVGDFHFQTFILDSSP